MPIHQVVITHTRLQFARLASCLQALLFMQHLQITRIICSRIGWHSCYSHNGCYGYRKIILEDRCKGGRRRVESIFKPLQIKQLRLPPFGHGTPCPYWAAHKKEGAAILTHPPEMLKTGASAFAATHGFDCTRIGRRGGLLHLWLLGLFRFFGAALLGAFVLAH